MPEKKQTKSCQLALKLAFYAALAQLPQQDAKLILPLNPPVKPWWKQMFTFYHPVVLSIN